MAKRKLFNATTQQVETATLSVDRNNEVIASFDDGSFVKFPAGLSPEQFDMLIELQQSANEGQDVLTPEVLAAQEAARANSYALIGDTPPVSQSNDEATTDSST